MIERGVIEESQADFPFVIFHFSFPFISFISFVTQFGFCTISSINSGISAMTNEK